MASFPPSIEVKAVGAFFWWKKSLE